MSRVPLRRIDASMMPRSFLREAAGRWVLFLLLAAGFLALLLSNGMNRYLSGRWALTAVLRPSVSPAEGEGIAKRAAALPGVSSAAYKDPETSWKEFLEAYPGLDPLRTSGASPLPGYVEIRVRPDRFSEADIRAVETAVKPIPEVEKVLSGAESLPALLHAARWANLLFRAAFALLCVVVFSVFFLQEKSRAALLSAEFDFLGERGVPGRRIALARAGGASLLNGFLALAAMAAAVSAYFPLEERLPPLRRFIGPASDIAIPAVLVPLVLFVVASAALAGAASLIGWRAARSVRK